MSPRAFRGAVILGVIVVLYFLSPPHLPVCAFRWFTGRPCPFCGLTRAMFALAKGHFGEAVRLHALSPLAAAAGIALAWNRRLPDRVWAPLLAVFCVYGVWRFLA
jgi:hypothetical protein